MVRVLQLVRQRYVRIPLYVSVVVLAVTVGYPGGIAAAYQSSSEIAALNEEMNQLNADRARMDREAVVVANRITVKEGLIEELIAGRQSLRCVAERFAEMNAEDVGGAVLRQLYPGASDLECNAKNVLVYAEQRAENASARELLMIELNRQYRVMFAE